jgi:uncharacterized membrane protein YjjP (DUF1212 family)
MDNGWHWMDAVPAAVAGAAGGLVRALTLKTGVIDTAIAVVVGALCSVYIGPAANPLIEKMGFDPTQSEHLAGFAIGLGGIAVTGLIVDGWRAFQRRQGGDQ